jgi:ABC-type transporter MlaC component
MTPPEQRQFLELFGNYVVATYSDRLSEYLAVGGEPGEP